MTRILGLLATVAMLLGFVGPVAAEGKGSTLAAIVEVGAGWTESDISGNATPDDDESAWTFTGAVRVNVPLFENVSMQLDAGMERRATHPDDNYQYGMPIGGHLSYRGDWGLVGVFLGGGWARGDDGDSGRLTARAIGIEGQAYLGDYTAYVQVGHMDANAHDGTRKDPMHDVWFGRFVGRWYPNANSRLELDLSYGDGNQDSSSYDMFAANWGLRYDHGLSKGWSAFAGYRGGWFENDDNGNDDDGKWTEHTVLIGIRYSFGGLGVKANDRKGAGLDLPNYMRWAAAGETLD